VKTENPTACATVNCKVCIDQRWRCNFNSKVMHIMALQHLWRGLRGTGISRRSKIKAAESEIAQIERHFPPPLQTHTINYSPPPSPPRSVDKLFALKRALLIEICLNYLNALILLRILLPRV
jgi:hypothetical protein